jgi:hypothetical protein
MGRTGTQRKVVTCGAITSRKLAQVSDGSERLYWRIYMASDKYGTISADAWDILGECVPNMRWTEAKVLKALEELQRVGLLHVWEEPDGTFWAHVIGHDKHQYKAWLDKRGKRMTPLPVGCECCGSHRGVELNSEREYVDSDPNSSLSVPKGSHRPPSEEEQEPKPISNDIEKTVMSETASRSRTVKQKTPDEIAADIETCRTKLGSNATLVAELAVVMAEQNKTGKVAESRTLRELWAPISDLASSIPELKLRYGLQRALAKPAPNANYVRTAAINAPDRPATPLTSASPRGFQPRHEVAEDYDGNTITIAS